MKIVRSIGKSQQEILSDILFLHNNGNPPDLDCTYSKGVFYKNGIVPQPKIKSDLSPQFSDVIQADSTNLPFSSNSMKCIIFDPPFIIHGNITGKQKEGSCKIFKRFSGYDNFNSLKRHYAKTLEQAYRVLEKNGILIFKLQNTVSSGKQHFTHFFTVGKAIDVGFYPKDEFVLESNGKITSFGGRWKTQKHSMKYHSYFLVFQKCERKIDYSV